MVKESRKESIMSKGIATKTGEKIDQMINQVRQSGLPRRSRAAAALGIAKTAGLLCNLAEKVGPKPKPGNETVDGFKWPDK